MKIEALDLEQAVEQLRASYEAGGRAAAQETFNHMAKVHRLKRFEMMILRDEFLKGIPPAPAGR